MHGAPGLWRGERGLRVEDPAFGVASEGSRCQGMGMGAGGRGMGRPAGVEGEAGGGDRVVVGEEDEPVLGDGAGEEAVALLDDAEWVEVEGHAPGGEEVGGGGDEVADEAGVASGASVGAGLDVDGEHVGGVAGEELEAEAGGDLGGGADLVVGEGG